MLHKIASNKILQYLSLGSELKNENGTVRNQYQRLNKFYGFYKNEDDKQEKDDIIITIKKYKKLDLIYYNRNNF